MQTLAKRYKIIKTLGSGGMGTVYLAESVSLGTKWAMKEIPKRAGNNFDLLAEPNILKNLNHPALPRIVDIEEDADAVYVIMDYIEGMPLDKQLHMCKYFDEATVIEWAKQLCEVLLYLHNQPRSIIYRDMKPSNIIVSADNRVKLIDFGIAREFKTDSGSDTSYMGTRGYAAPEQYGTSQTDARTDIYSLGVTMYHLLTGKSPNEPPYEFKMLRQLNKGFSEGIEFIVNKCVQNDPANRYQSVGELLYDLQNIFVFNSYYKHAKVMDKVRAVFQGVLIVGFSLLVYASSHVLSAEKAVVYQSYIEDGDAALNRYQFDQALNAFNEASKMDPNGKTAYLGIAQILLKQLKYDECIDYLDKVAGEIRGMETDAQYNYLKGTVYYEKEDYRNACVSLQNAANEDPSSIIYSRDLAVCYAKDQNVPQARTILDNLTALDTPDDVLAYVNGQVFLAEDNTDTAIHSFEKSINESKDPIIKKKAYLELSNIYKGMRHNNMQGAASVALPKQIEVLERAVRDLNDEDDLILTEAMAESYFTAQRYPLAIAKFQKLLDIGYDRAYIYRNLAIIYQQTNDFPTAESKLIEMKERYPDDYRCYLQFAFLYLDWEGRKAENSRNYQKVVDNYNLAVKFAPTGANTTDLIPLANKISELRQKGWL